jgi:hypothetical protein
MANVTTPSGITVSFHGPEDLPWEEAKEIAMRMSNATAEDVEFALGLMIEGWGGENVQGQPPTVERNEDGRLKRDEFGNPIVHANGLARVKMRYVNEIAEVIMAAATAEGKATETGS